MSDWLFIYLFNIHIMDGGLIVQLTSVNDIFELVFINITKLNRL